MVAAKFHTLCPSVEIQFPTLQTELCELREEAAELRSQKFQADNRIRQLELMAMESQNKVVPVSTVT